MEKQKRWHFWLIAAVIAWTLYNILPTIFYYSQPLNEPIGKPQAENVASEIIERINSLEEEAVSWIHTFSKNLGVKPVKVEIRQDDPSFVDVEFTNSQEARIFRRFLPEAGSLIPFVPAQLKIAPDTGTIEDNTVVVERSIPVHLNPEDRGKLFQFSSKVEDGKIAPLYRKLVYDRTLTIAEALAGPSIPARQVGAILDTKEKEVQNEMVLSLAREIGSISRQFGIDHPFVERYYASFTQTDREDKGEMIQKFIAKLDEAKKEAESKLATLDEEISSKQAKDELIDLQKSDERDILKTNVEALSVASDTVKKNLALFQKGKTPLSRKELAQRLVETGKTIDPKDFVQTLTIEGFDPFIQGLKLDWTDGWLDLITYKDIDQLRSKPATGEGEELAKEKLNQLLYTSIARISRQTDETLSPSIDGYRITLEKLTNSDSFLAMNLGYLAEKEAGLVQGRLKDSWFPEHPDLGQDVYPVRTYSEYLKESPEAQRLGLVIYAPSRQAGIPPEGFRESSIYVIAKGMDQILEKAKAFPDSPETEALLDDIRSLQDLLEQRGFIVYSGRSYGIDPAFKSDYIFELNQYYDDLLSASREDFYVKGSKRFAVLDFTDVEQRILAENTIEDRMQEDLIQWQDDYNSAQVSLEPTRKYMVPPPNKSILWNNFKISLGKYFGGDERKVLKWGLDLSGGKTVRIGLRDKNNQPVTNPEDVNQAVNELYSRINKLGVSEQTIRTEGNTIVLEFPGSQAFSANELVKASAMYFHIANEKFNLGNSELAPTINAYLQEVWNEAVVTNRKEIDQVNTIAWKLLGGDPETGEMGPAKSEHARTLLQNGLKIANPYTDQRTSTFNDSTSMIARMRGDDLSEWQGQSHPLMIVFNNYALEGSNLEGVNVGYDPTEGNLLTFGVKSSYEGSSADAASSPRQDLYTWTSNFAEEKIAGTPKETFAPRGWRMAVILNGEVISSPQLRAALSSSGSISGRFTQREISQLASDLKAGSLSFTPRILSEQNVSPELGQEERSNGITASLIAIGLVAVAMIGYYRFAGLVATIAVLFNLLIIWGVLQSIGAALTLPGIAGIVLTIGMAVDANVLVFERIREEFAVSGRLASAIQAGYRKAFTAIIDSNLTTIMAALILIQFDSGPIKGFAIVLIIGILSSMFTSLFVTRYFFSGWVRKTKAKALHMMHVIGDTKIDFLKFAKPAVAISLVIMVFGGYLLAEQRNTIFGMDFTGGYALIVNLDEEQDVNFRKKADDALLSAGAKSGDVEVRELSRPNQLRIQLGMSMEEPGHPFHQMAEELEAGATEYDYQINPRIVWVVDALQKQGLKIQESQLENLDKNWNVMSGQLSDTMRNNAMIALSCALVGILLYITFRFELKYALGAVIALAHDVIITLGILAFFHELGFPVQIDLQVIGAIMTIIGYSLNDTIIVFDRIREDAVLYRKWSFHDIINHALNITLSRTLMTSGTTLLVLLSLVLFGGSSIFAFSLVMTVGVLVGTFSSLFIASPAMLFFHRREKEQKKNQHAKA